jgi:urea transport system ATP-binding protein
MTILLVEQNLKFVRAVADCFVILDRGRAVAAGQISMLHEGLIKEYLTV